MHSFPYNNVIRWNSNNVNVSLIPPSGPPRLPSNLPVQPCILLFLYRRSLAFVLHTHHLAPYEPFYGFGMYVKTERHRTMVTTIMMTTITSEKHTGKDLLINAVLIVSFPHLHPCHIMGKANFKMSLP